MNDIKITTEKKPVRLSIAQRICRPLPPIFSQRVRNWIYPKDIAFRDNYEFVVRSITGSKFIGKTSDFHAYPFAVHGYFYWRALAIAASVCSSGNEILEIGANVGTETVGFSDIVGKTGRVHAFEPFPPNIENLNKNAVINKKNNIIVYPLAVSDKNEIVHFATPPNTHVSGIGYVIVNYDNVPKPEAIKIRCITIDSMIDAFLDLKFIFIDAEGSEIHILQGATKVVSKFHPYLLIEASEKLLNRMNFNLLYLKSVIDELGYKAFHVTKFGLKSVNNKNLSISNNWFCVHDSDDFMIAKTMKKIRKSALLPPVLGINPLNRIKA